MGLKPLKKAVSENTTDCVDKYQIFSLLWGGGRCFCIVLTLGSVKCYICCGGSDRQQLIEAKRKFSLVKQQVW